ncbi:MAG: hypothetical protein HYY04_14320 [Chloroflexi bacterium]|nr:hypothetical protein [Chloroflexota bacterium]
MTKESQATEHALRELEHRRTQLRDWLQFEETSREGAANRRADVLRGRLEEVEWAISLLRSSRPE